MLGRLYGRAARLRRAWYARRPHRSRTLAQAVVSVGNLSVGGSGKTPLVATLARLLSAQGERPAILTRGYGRRGRPDGVVVVSDGSQVLEPVARSGDEPQMLARALSGVPVLVSADRYLAGRLAEERFGCTVHLLDDGFQHVQLSRDVNLLIVTRADLDEAVLPAGRLREDLAASGAADAMLVPGPEEDAQAVAAALGPASMFRLVAGYAPLRLVDASGASFSAGAGRRVLAMAGIARPERFFDALRAEGWDVVGERQFRDHHWFSSGDLRAVAEAAALARADAIVTTEKDVARLDAAALRTCTPLPVACLPMRVSVEPSDAFVEWLTGRIRAARLKRGIAA